MRKANQDELNVGPHGSEPHDPYRSHLRLVSKIETQAMNAANEFSGVDVSWVPTPAANGAKLNTLAASDVLHVSKVRLK